MAAKTAHLFAKMVSANPYPIVHNVKQILNSSQVLAHAVSATKHNTLIKIQHAVSTVIQHVLLVVSKAALYANLVLLTEKVSVANVSLGLS